MNPCKSYAVTDSKYIYFIPSIPQINIFIDVCNNEWNYRTFHFIYGQTGSEEAIN